MDERFGRQIDVDCDAGSEPVSRRRRGDEPLLATADRCARGTQSADDPAQRRPPGCREVIAPKDRRQPIARNLLARQRQSDESDLGSSPSELLPRH